MTLGSNNKLLYLLSRLWFHIGSERRKQFFALAVLMIFAAIAEVVSLGAVVPFLGILAAPDVALKHSYVQQVGHMLGDSRESLVLFFTTTFIVAALIAGGVRLLLLWYTTHVAFKAGSDLSIELYRRTLYQPYSVHIGRNSSAVLSGVGKVGGAMNILSQCLLLASSLILLVAITAALLVMDPLVAFVSIVGFGVSYGAIAVFTRSKLRSNGLRIAKEQTQVFKAIQEGLGGIRDVLLDGTQKLYCDVYQRSDRALRRDQGANVLISGSPRFAMESLGLVLIALLAFALSKQSGGVATALPMLGALALGAQRLLPVLQQGYSAWATILGNQASLADTIDLLEQPIQAEMLSPAPEPMQFHDAIRFDDVKFRYTEDGPWILRGLTLTIAKGSRIGLVGATGSGKSTTLDILMGLLTPTDGKLLVDDKVVGSDRMRSWQRTIAHVPQSIYLSDASFVENIALGVPTEKIDMERVKRAAQQAQIAEFIESCSLGYLTPVGERGTRLSGGQRQRVGIARALYKQASVLVFDEATSALDTVTENSLMESITALNRDLTILMIAHRVSTVRQCDVVIEMKGGAIHAIGDYETLLRESASFKLLAGGNV